MAKKKKRAKGTGSSPAAAAAEAPDLAAAESASARGMPAPPAVPAQPLAPSMLARVLIALVLAYELLMPLRYYLGGRGYDERFSWRMFSTVRLQKCRVRVNDVLENGDSLQDRPVRLEQVLQVAWVGMLERYRKPVVEKLLQRRCEQPGVQKARLERRCTDTDGSALPAIEVVLDCKSGRLATAEEKP